jgi:predicted nucleotidyltransferase
MPADREGIVEEARERRAPDRRTEPERIERFVGDLMRRFEPERVILFGGSVPGSPQATREVGLLVVMPFEGRSLAEAIRIERELKPEFPLDLVVRRPHEVAHALEIGDSFIKGIVEKGRVLHARPGGWTQSGGEEGRLQESKGIIRRGTPSEETIQTIVRQIVAAVDPEQVVLFGSAARGEMGPDSDLDFLVVKPCANRREVAQTIYRNLRGIGVPKDIVVVTPEDVERDRDTIGYIIRPALREGRVVYAR